MGLLMAKQEVLLRAIVTKDKPEEMLKVSPKGTVPVLLFENGTVIEESLDIMLWALKQNDPSNLLQLSNVESLPKMLEIIKIYDLEYRPILSAYKAAKRFHLDTEDILREQCEIYMKSLEQNLEDRDYIFNDQMSLVDLAILPFIRQFMNVDKKWFRDAGYPLLSSWLSRNLQSLLFTKTMRKYPLWLDCQEEFVLNWNNEIVGYKSNR